jgi:Putative 2OG-Fe(II) oxygenase
VLLRHEPILQRAREAWIAAIRGLIAQLPAHEEGHPFLSRPRGHLLLGGSWSVRLAGEGHNVPHTHPMGWLSSSLYVAIPDTSQRGPAPAGHIVFGTPPPELGLDLPAYRTIAPEPGMVVTFPSTMWHAVAPFAAGERLMIALDIRPPDY